MDAWSIGLTLLSEGAGLYGSLMEADQLELQAAYDQWRGDIAVERANLTAMNTLTMGTAEEAQFAREVALRTAEAQFDAFSSGRNVGVGSSRLAFEQSEENINRALENMGRNTQSRAASQVSAGISQRDDLHAAAEQRRAMAKYKRISGGVGLISGLEEGAGLKDIFGGPAADVWGALKRVVGR